MSRTKYHESEKEKSRIKFLGTQHEHKQYGKYMLVEYINNQKVRIIFERTGYELTTSLQAVRNKVVQDPLQPSLYGVAILGLPLKSYPTKLTKEAYRSYVSMIERVYVRKFNTYIDCSVREDWLVFENYKAFFCEDSWRQDGWQLDKDLLVYGNRIYSKDTCVFLPPEINITMTTYREQRTEASHNLPPGVSYLSRGKKRYKIHKIAACMDPPVKTSEFFNDPKEAYREYKKFRESVWKYLADKWEGKIDPRATKALREREFLKGEYDEWLR